MITVDIRLTDDRLRDLPRETRKRAAEHIKRTAFKVEEYAKVGAPVDTGFLRNSIYTVTHDSSGYTRASNDAHAQNADAVMLPEVETPRDALTAVVAVGAEYGAYVNYGTARAAAQPYLDDAIEQAREYWEEGLRELFR